MLQFILFMMNLNLKHPEHMLPVPLPEPSEGSSCGQLPHASLESGSMHDAYWKGDMHHLVDQDRAN